MSQTRLTNDEIGRRGEELYDQHIRAQVEPQHTGEYLALDVGSGDYEIGPSYALLTQRLRARHPNAAVYILRIGYPVAARIGGAFLRTVP